MRSLKRFALSIIALLTAMARVMAIIYADELGAIAVKSAADSAAKWGSQTPTRQSYYEAGVKGAGAAWLSGATAAASNFDAAVKSGNIKQMFLGGVKKAGADKYQNKAGTLGAQRFSQGVQAATGDYQNAVEPYISTIAGLTLAARAPRGSASNLQRVTQVATALNAKRMSLRAAGA